MQTATCDQCGRTDKLMDHSDRRLDPWLRIAAVRGLDWDVCSLECAHKLLDGPVQTWIARHNKDARMFHENNPDYREREGERMNRVRPGLLR